MEQIELTAEQIETLADWAESGDDLLPLTLQVEAPRYVSRWASGDVFVTQGDSYIQIGRDGAIKDSLPSRPLTRG